jgi:hypothetical protein
MSMTLARIHNASPALVITSSVFVALAVLSFLAGLYDSREIAGSGVWEKPMKFYISLAVHMATLAWGLSLMRKENRDSRVLRGAIAIFVACALFEMIYITLQAARGEASHFNISTPLTALLYNLMGFAAVLLVGTTAFIGWRMTRASTSLMQTAAGWSFVASGMATLIVAGYLGSNGSHSIGGDLSDASGLPFFRWSTTGGDLRPAHFAALHIMQAVPLIVWFWPRRDIAFASIAVGLGLTAALFAQALMGIPLLRA